MIKRKVKQNIFKRFQPNPKKSTNSRRVTKDPVLWQSYFPLLSLYRIRVIQSVGHSGLQTVNLYQLFTLSLVLSTMDCRLIAESCNHMPPGPAGTEWVKAGYETSEAMAHRAISTAGWFKTRSPGFGCKRAYKNLYKPCLTMSNKRAHFSVNGPNRCVLLHYLTEDRLLTAGGKTYLSSSRTRFWNTNHPLNASKYFS